MIHFFLTFSNDASQSPFAQALRDLGVSHRIISRRVLLRYRRRIWLLLVGLPRLAATAARNVWLSLVSESRAPDVIVVGSHIEAAIAHFGRCLVRREVAVVLLGFIFTTRTSRWLDGFRRAYFGWLFRRIDMIICHSILERDRYNTIFPAALGKFRFVPYGLHIEGYEQIEAFQDPLAHAALSAGRSGRDYGLLTSVFARSGRPLRIVCDSTMALQGCEDAPNIVVLRDCYDDAYTQELRQAGIVIVPLSVTDISAGQMVLVQAMAYRKPLIVTRTPTVENYLQHERNALLVPPGDRDALQLAVDRVCTEPGLAQRLAEAAYQTYLEEFSMKVFVTRIVNTVNGAPNE